LNDRSQCLEAIDTDGRGLQVLFFWNGDRYAHRIEVLDGNAASVLMESREGDDGDEWPLSSPLQQLSIENRPDNRQVALLVGMAGQSHWSASVTADSNERSLLFEMACRTKDSPAKLSNSYHINADMQPIAANDNLIQWPQVSLSSKLATLQLAASTGAVQVRARTTEVDGLRTVQWSYKLRTLSD
jgi:hypothetical protein